MALFEPQNNTGTTTASSRGIWGDATYLNATDVIPSALLLTQATQAGALAGDAPVIRVPFIGARPTATIVREGERIQESNPTLDEMAYRTIKIALVSRMSNEAASNGSATELVSASLQNAVTFKADDVFLNGDPAVADPAGRPVLGMLNGGAAMATGNITDSLDPLLDVLGTIGDNGGNPTALIMSFGTWAQLLKLKASANVPLLNPDVANAPAPVLFGVPVVFNTAMPSGRILVHDAAEVYASVSQVTVAKSADYYFDSDSSAIRVTFRCGFGVIHPDRFGVLTVGKTSGRTTK